MGDVVLFNLAQMATTSDSRASVLQDLRPLDPIGNSEGDAHDAASKTHASTLLLSRENRLGRVSGVSRIPFSDGCCGTARGAAFCSGSCRGGADHLAL